MFIISCGDIDFVYKEDKNLINPLPLLLISFSIPNDQDDDDRVLKFEYMESVDISTLVFA